MIVKRIQRKRTKGWKMPENTVYVGRPTKWGNPFIIGRTVMFPPIFAIIISDGINELYRDLVKGIEVKDIKHSMELYKKYMSIFTAKKFMELKGKNLACWCSLDEICHADILLKLANKK